MRRRAQSPAGPPTTTARTAALLLLGRRDYTLKELRTRLLAKGHAPEQVDDALSGLSAEGLQSDERVAAAYIRTATRIRGRGRLRIARELEARGVDRGLVARLVAAIEPDDEMGSIREILRRKRWPAAPTPADRRRMFQHLLRRGFSGDAISKALGGRDHED